MPYTASPHSSCRPANPSPQTHSRYRRNTQRCPFGSRAVCCFMLDFCVTSALLRGSVVDASSGGFPWSDWGSTSDIRISACPMQWNLSWSPSYQPTRQSQAQSACAQYMSLPYTQSFATFNLRNLERSGPALPDRFAKNALRPSPNERRLSRGVGEHKRVCFRRAIP